MSGTQYNYDRQPRRQATRLQLLAAKLALLLVVLLLIASSCACRDSGGGQVTPEASGVTATYGAQWYATQSASLTEVAEPTPQP